MVGPSGRIVPPKDVSALAGAWHVMMNLPAKERMELQLLARHRVQKNFALPVIASLYEALHESLIGYPAPPSGAQPSGQPCLVG